MSCQLGTVCSLTAGKRISFSTGYNSEGKSTSVNNTSISTPTCVNETACEKDTVAFQSTGTLNRVAPTHLWSLQWCHFLRPCPCLLSMRKYKERGGSPVFHPSDPALLPPSSRTSTDWFFNFRLYKRYADQRIVVRPAYIAYGAVMASREQDGEPEATGTGRDKEL